MTKFQTLHELQVEPSKTKKKKKTDPARRYLLVLNKFPSLLRDREEEIDCYGWNKDWILKILESESRPGIV